MKNIFLVCALCILLTFTGCGQKSLPPLTDETPNMLKETFKTRNGDWVNTYPEINISNITSLPVYKVGTNSLDDLYEDVLSLESAYGEPVPFTEWRIQNNEYNIELTNTVSAEEYGFDFNDTEKSFSANHDGFRIYLRDILHDRNIERFTLLFDTFSPTEIDETMDCAAAAEILRSVYEEHMNNYDFIYDGFFYTDYRYYVVENIVDKRGLILNFRQKELLSDQEVLLDYYDICDKVSFEIQWHKEVPEDFPFSYSYTSIPLYIRKFSTNNYDFLGNYDIITVDEAKIRFENGDKIFYINSRKLPYDDIYLAYIIDAQGYIRPIYTAVNHGEDLMYVMWTDAIE